MPGIARTETLFVYASLREPEVQRDLFGRVLEGSVDTLRGYTVDYITAADPRVSDGAQRTPRAMLRATGSDLDRVVGVAAAVSLDELDAADEFEHIGFRRTVVTLASGRRAWLYLP